LSKLQGGLRYILALYPFLFIWLGNLTNVDVKNFAQYLYKRIVVILMTWYVFIAIATYPDYLSYFNEFVGGMNGSGYKITKDFDWGQDLPGLATYMENNNIEKITLLFWHRKPGFLRDKVSASDRGGVP